MRISVATLTFWRLKVEIEREKERDLMSMGIWHIKDPSSQYVVLYTWNAYAINTLISINNKENIALSGSALHRSIECLESKSRAIA